LDDAVVSLDEREPLEESGVDYGEDRRTDSGAHCEHGDEDDRQAGTFSKRTQASPCVKNGGVHRQRSHDEFLYPVKPGTVLVAWRAIAGYLQRWHAAS
jgi:hypothetical protein